jgi:hypothetical protein
VRRECKVGEALHKVLVAFVHVSSPRVWAAEMFRNDQFYQHTALIRDKYSDFKQVSMRNKKVLNLSLSQGPPKSRTFALAVMETREIKNSADDQV